MLFSSRSYLAALNALLAEHALSLIELVPENSFALRLREGIIAAGRVGSHTTFDQDAWIQGFNYESRIVQLNLVAFGLSELGMQPMLAGEYWRPVRNPFVLRNVEAKIPKATKYIRSAHGESISLRSSKLKITDWGVADLEEPKEPEQVHGVPNPAFMIELPDPESSAPDFVFSYGSHTVFYYESPQLIGEAAAGLLPPYRYPQVAVVALGHEQPAYIVRIEESEFGSMLCIIYPSGMRANLGAFSRTRRDVFLRKIEEIIQQAK